MLDRILRTVVSTGRLDLIAPEGRRIVCGEIDAAGPTIRIKDRRTWWRIARNPQLGFGEAYMDGALTVEDGDIAAVLDVLMRNLGTAPGGRWLAALAALRGGVRRLRQFNPAPRSRRNVAHHYDITGEVYDLFLDPDRQYSCAYFERPGITLEEAQAAKKRHIAAKLHLHRPGLRVLEVGSGWGGLALDLARARQCRVHGVTLSQEQLALSRERAAAAGLQGAVEFTLTDYRAVQGAYDRIVSVGMFEHVGVGHYRAFFEKAAALLADDGVMLLHSIGRSDGPGATNPWIAKHIFPGGYTPALSEVLPHIERAGLIVTDVEILRLHYAETCKAWRMRFRANWDRAAALMGERFCRMWEFYLAGAEMGFRHQGLMVFQIQLSKRVDAVPLTRAYIAEEEVALAATPPQGRPRAA